MMTADSSLATLLDSSNHVGRHVKYFVRRAQTLGLSNDKERILDPNGRRIRLTSGLCLFPDFSECTSKVGRRFSAVSRQT